jgi:predicted site-specific integrase-resolvase
MTKLIETTEVARRANVPYHTLISWVRFGYLWPRRHPGKQWAKILWTEKDATKAIAIAKLRRRHAREWAKITGRTA